MQIHRIQSALPISDLEARLRDRTALLLDPKKIKSKEEIRLAHALAERCLARQTAIARSLPFETLLWLSGKRDIRRALAEFGAKTSNDILLLTFGPLALRKLGAKKRPLGLSKKATWQALERISLSRI